MWRKKRSLKLGSREWMLDLDWLSISPYGNSDNNFWCRLCRREIQPKKHTIFKHRESMRHREKENQPMNCIKKEQISAENRPTENIQIRVHPDFYNNITEEPPAASSMDIVAEAVNTISNCSPRETKLGILAQARNLTNSGPILSKALAYLPPVDASWDADKSFLLSLHDDMKELPSKLKLKFKSSVLKLMEFSLYNSDCLIVDQVQVNPLTNADKNEVFRVVE